MTRKLFTLFFGLAIAAILCNPLVSKSQDTKETKTDSSYQFTLVKNIPCTPVKDQYRSGTCWSFSTISYLESELLRTGKGEYDLTDIIPVRDD